jgi:hypothetical protein
MPPEPPPSGFQLRVKAWTVVLTTATIAALLLNDWDAATGRETVFSGIRPTIKNALNTIYGVKSSQEPQTTITDAADAKSSQN